MVYVIGHSGTIFRVLFSKISTGQEKLAPTGRHGRHVFATLTITIRAPVGANELAKLRGDRLLGFGCFFGKIPNGL